jgi:hypothetical protein
MDFDAVEVQQMYKNAFRSTRPHDEVDTAIGIHDIAHLVHSQTERNVLEWLLHLTTLEPSEISTMRMRTAIRVFLRMVGEFLWRSVDLCLMLAQELDGLLL